LKTYRKRNFKLECENFVFEKAVRISEKLLAAKVILSKNWMDYIKIWIASRIEELNSKSVEVRAMLYIGCFTDGDFMGIKKSNKWNLIDFWWWKELMNEISKLRVVLA
jgi:hypothetical protein